MVYVFIAVALFISDSIIKYVVEKDKISEKVREKINNKIVLKKYHNKGAMLDIGASKQYIVAVISLIFTVFMSGVFVATLGYKGKKTLKVGLALILGGAYCNTYDRIRRKYVVDYISFNVKSKYKVLNRFGEIVFNISDFGIIIGSVLLVVGESINIK